MAATATNAGAITRIPYSCAQQAAPRLCAIHLHRAYANYWRSRLMLSPLPYAYVAERRPELRDAILTYWVGVHRHARYRALTSPPWLTGMWYNAAMCVHSKEGAWNSISNTTPTYYGGMQFSLSTWQANGGEGRPDLQPPAEQLRISYRTWQASGWHPWPNTAAACGLL